MFTKPREDKKYDGFDWFWWVIDWSISSVPAVVAAVGKAFTYSFGVFTFMAIVATGAISPPVWFMASGWMPLALSIGGCVFFISLAMEGAWLASKLYDYEWREQPDPNEADIINECHQKARKKAVRLVRDTLIDARITEELALLKANHYAKYLGYRLLQGLLYTVGTLIYVFAGLAKGLSAFSGTVGVMVYLLKARGIIDGIVIGLNPVAISIIIPAAIFGACIALVCLGKEGAKFKTRMHDFNRWAMRAMLGVEEVQQEKSDLVKSQFASFYQRELVDMLTQVNPYHLQEYLAKYREDQDFAEFMLKVRGPAGVPAPKSSDSAPSTDKDTLGEGSEPVSPRYASQAGDLMVAESTVEYLLRRFEGESFENPGAKRPAARPKTPEPDIFATKFDWKKYTYWLNHSSGERQKGEERKPLLADEKNDILSSQLI